MTELSSFVFVAPVFVLTHNAGVFFCTHNHFLLSFYIVMVCKSKQNFDSGSKNAIRLAPNMDQLLHIFHHLEILC